METCSYKRTYSLTHSEKCELSAQKTMILRADGKESQYLLCDMHYDAHTKRIESLYEKDRIEMSDLEWDAKTQMYQ